MSRFGEIRVVRRASAVLMAATLAGATPSLAAQAAGGASAVWDPFESFNRAMYSFNEAFASAAAGPLVDGYRDYVPLSVRTSVDNFFSNLREPVTAVSSTLQGDLSNAGISIGRFAINSTAGIAGLFDVASELDWRPRPQDLGVALCKYGVPSGPYVVLPFLGASTMRESAGIFATYTLAYNISHDIFPGYVVLDGAAARAEEPPALSIPVPVATSTYEAQRTAYLSFRDSLCADALPAEMLKATPLGQVKLKGQ